MPSQSVGGGVELEVAAAATPVVQGGRLELDLTSHGLRACMHVFSEDSQHQPTGKPETERY